MTEGRDEKGEKKRKRMEDGEGSPLDLGILSERERVRSVVMKDRDTFRFIGMDYYNDSKVGGGVRMMVTRFEHLKNIDGIMDIRQAGLSGLKTEKWLELRIN